MTANTFDLLRFASKLADEGLRLAKAAPTDHPNVFIAMMSASYTCGAIVAAISACEKEEGNGK